jgi:prophage tail gpP-like protein
VTFLQGQPEKEQVRLRLRRANIDLTSWERYSFNSNFLQPSDAFSFTVGAEKLDDQTKDALQVGAEVQLILNGQTQADGYIDGITVSASPSGGVEYQIDGRDRLSRAVDSNADPTLTFKASMSLLDVLKKIFGPFGWSSDEHFIEDNDANIGVLSGTPSEATGSRTAKKHFGEVLKSTKIHQLRPHNGEGAFAFASRLTQRHGLWIWPSSDGEQLIVSRPGFTAEPIYKIRQGSKR